MNDPFLKPRYRPAQALRAMAAAAMMVCLAAEAPAPPPPPELDPTIKSWMINFTGVKGTSANSAINAVVSTIDADVSRVRFNMTDVYVNAPSIPSHTIGTWDDGNPAIPIDIDGLYRFPRTPPTEAVSKTDVFVGPIGIFINGVIMYNYSDTESYDNKGIWNNNAIVVREDGFDSGLGHPSPLTMMGAGAANPYAHTHSGLEGGIWHSHGGKAESSDTPLDPGQLPIQAPPPTPTPGPVDGQYHYHQQPPLLRQQVGDNGTNHSPVLGYMFDGSPVYGPYAYANTDGTGGITRMNPSYQIRTGMTTRTTLPDDTVLPMADWGPNVGGSYPLGYFIEDFKYNSGSGHLDQYNGRFAVTPDYPLGVYAYYATIDSGGNSAFPYLIGPQFWAAPIPENSSQTVTVPGGVDEVLPPPASVANWTIY